MAVAVTPMYAQQDAAQQMIAADKALWQAMTGPQPDMAKIEAGYAKDYVDVSFGTVHTREEDLEQTKVMRNFTFEYANPHAVVLSPTSGYVVAEISYFGMVGGSSYKNKVLTTTVFSLEKGQWLARMQMSEPSTAPAKTIAVADDDPTLVALRKLASEVEAKVHVPGYAAFPAPKVKLDAGMTISYFSFGDNTAHETEFGALPEPMQGVWNQWASYTKDQPTGKALFDDMFHRFFFVHELGHGISGHVIAGLPANEMAVVSKNEANNKWATETSANRIAVAWYREHDPEYLKKLVDDFRAIEAQLPNPVPAGQDKKTFFTENYAQLGTNPLAYGWYQLQMVIVVYDEPAQSFQQVLDGLPKNKYE
jgi:hypothetical protein